MIINTVVNAYAVNGILTAGNPNYYRTAFLADATGQANGVGYAADESRHAWVLTYTGNAAIASEKFEFDGAGDYIDAPTSLLFTPGSKFTMELFGLEFDAVNTGTPQVICGQYEADAGEIGWRIEESGGNLQFAWSADGSSTTNTLTIAAVSASTEYDVSINWDGSTVYALVDGAAAADTAFTGVFFHAPVRLRLGAAADDNAPALYLNGRFSAFAYTKGETLYASNGLHAVPSLPRTMDTPSLTDSDWPNVVLLLGYDGSRIKDYGPLDLRIVVNGNAAGSTVVTIADGTYSIALDGTGDFLATNDDALLEIGAGDVTVETFARHTVNNVSHTYAGKWTTTGNQRSWIFQYRGDQATDVLRATYDADGASGSSVTINSGAWTPAVDTFYHVAWCRDGSDDHRFFVDGTQQGATVNNAVSAFDSTAILRIGTIESGEGMNGYLTQVRITKAARYTANFTAPTGALPIG